MSQFWVEAHHKLQATGQLVFTGKGTPPKEISSETDVIELVKNNQNIIAYIDSDKVTGDVRVIATK